MTRISQPVWPWQEGPEAKKTDQLTPEIVKRAVEQLKQPKSEIRVFVDTTGYGYLIGDYVKVVSAIEPDEP